MTCSAARAAWVLGLALLAVSHSTAEALPGSPALMEVSSGNFSTTMDTVGKDYDWLLLEFYAHWCPACKHFQPSYIQIAEHLAARGRTDPTIAVARIDCPENEDLCNKFEITGYPTILLGKADKFAAKSRKGVTTLEPNPRSKDGVLRAIAKELGTSVDLPKAGGDGAGVVDGVKDGAKRGAGGVKAPANAPADANDIEGATLKSWQFLSSAQMLKGLEARAALTEWLDLLSETHPVSRCREGAATAAEVLVTAWPPGTDDAAFPAALHDVQICGASEFKDWTGCKGSLPSSRGFTCGMWSLFHSLSVHLPDDDPKAGKWWLHAVRGYVKHFFQCSDCARHFVKHASSEMAEAVVSKKDAVLWIWHAHNAVNERLKKEEAESGSGDPAFPKALWPSVEACASCRSGDEGWNEEAVYAFLLKHYAAGKGEFAAASVGRRGSVGAGRRGGGFSTSWSLALALAGGVSAAAYAVLRHSGQYAYRKAVTRKL